MRARIVLALMAILALVGAPSRSDYDPDGPWRDPALDDIREARIVVYWRRILDVLAWPAGWLGGAFPWSRSRR